MTAVASCLAWHQAASGAWQLLSGDADGQVCVWQLSAGEVEEAPRAPRELWRADSPSCRAVRSCRARPERRPEAERDARRGARAGQVLYDGREARQAGRGEACADQDALALGGVGRRAWPALL